MFKHSHKMNSYKWSCVEVMSIYSFDDCCPPSRLYRGELSSLRVSSKKGEKVKR